MKKAKIIKDDNYYIDKALKFCNEQYDWHYSSIEIEYDRTSCTGCEDYCRCAKIINAEIESLNINEFLSNFLDDSAPAILNYCIDRIVRLAKISKDSFEINVAQGYYGEEIDSVTLDSGIVKKLYKNIVKLKDLLGIQKIKHVLTLEYGYLLDSIKWLDNYKIEEIWLNEISYNDDYRKKVDISENYYDKDFTLPRGIFIKKGDQYKLIDGYHRTLKAKSIGLTRINVIVLS